jgi:hypothetical protein
MESLHTVKNLYTGVNAHFKSYLQHQHQWKSFHNAYITYLMEGMKAQLRPMGYVAEIEQSLQIRYMDGVKRHASDVLIYDERPFWREEVPHTTVLEANAVAIGDYVKVDLEEHDLREHPYMAVVIYPREQKKEAVAWIEVLSPTNKGTSTEGAIYRSKRDLLLESGLVLVEIDLLHETPPMSFYLKDYSQKQWREQAFPYHVAISTPRPNIQSGFTHLYQWHVGEKLPTLKIPLNGNDQLIFDMDNHYQTMFSRAFYGDYVDYAQVPPNFDHYSDTDRAYILSLMIAIHDAHQQKIDLENGVIQVTGLSFVQAQKEWATRQS